jgi:SAM-dependent methyltransferase
MRNLSDDEILSLVEDYMNGSEHPDQVGYRKQINGREFANKKMFLSDLKRLAQIGDFHGKRILDVGCGFGWQAFTFALLDKQNQVVGLDILPSMVDGMTESITTMRKTGLDFHLVPICGDVCNPQLEAGSFDAIYSMEAIEHVHDLQKMFQRCAELLKPGGQIFLMNDSNVLHRKTRDETVAMWHDREYSWDWIAKLKNWRPVEHGNAKPFAVMRRDIVREANPKLDDEAVGIVVDRTAGLIKLEIAQLAREYQPGMKFPFIDQYDRCRNPETGEYAERLLDPYKLVKLLQECGFKTNIRHCFRRFPLSHINAIAFRPLNNYLFNLRGAFMIVGEKRKVFIEQAADSRCRIDAASIVPREIKFIVSAELP